MSEARTKASLAREASIRLGRASASARSGAIRAAARLILERSADICSANERDLARGREAGMPAPLQDRLLLDDGRLRSIASALEDIARQDDPLGRVVGGRTLDCGVRIEQVSVPLGVVAIVYEARPNVTADAFALCVRSGNACVLKGGSAARESCEAIAAACRDALAEAGLPADALQYVSDNAAHTETDELIRANDLVDALIPRGGAALIRRCVERATVPVIETGTGNCHIYLHREADVEKAVRIVTNAKCSRPGVCNAAESLLVDSCAAGRLLPPVLLALSERGVELVGDDGARAAAASCGVEMGAATEEDWGTEYLDLKMSVCCVEGVEEAIEHVNRYGTGHSEAIVSESYAACEAFLAGVDAAAVYANASTRFTDGGVFGLGGEIGISTQKLHARGPMGAAALTTTKYLARGDGQVR
ncbi:glutamate-5-semialdehyde dehydrogenase [Thermophilibacter provencensis]|uniref:glutamate-5-semialdehyde dehydrogenase n=1 Tax=Thermophilibacter provencensis TaxID=1852386 RepID=UPI002356DBFC|nr:glutamate-5-semialdehyde dehydrogenase [Thermophilibacter provencensis]